MFSFNCICGKDMEVIKGGRADLGANSTPPSFSVANTRPSWLPSVPSRRFLPQIGHRSLPRKDTSLGTIWLLHECFAIGLIQRIVKMKYSCVGGIHPLLGSSSKGDQTKDCWSVAWLFSFTVCALLSWKIRAVCDATRRRCCSKG